MPTNDYHFITVWRVESTIDEVSTILGDAPDLVRWWPSVYLEVKVLEPGDERGLGKVVSLYTKGWLPYTLRWSFTVTENRRPHGFTLIPDGDFEGKGVWTLEQDGDWCDITYEWRVDARKPLLRALSPLMRPLLAANHRWAMARGEESLRLELERRRAPDGAARARVPSPPGPTFRGPGLFTNR